ncbi:hypothetical protein BGZ82_006469 [Podila clonocystis]|nr:hypothetical protein BGZ82_006469 [Podila clonocystis]
MTVSRSKVDFALAAASLVYRSEQPQRNIKQYRRPVSATATEFALDIPEILQHILRFIPKRSLCNLGRVSHTFRAAVLASSCPLLLDETKIPPDEQERFLRVNGSRIYKAELSSDISINNDKPEFQRLLASVRQHCPRVQDIRLHVLNARNLTYHHGLPQLKNLTSAVKDLISNAKHLDTLTLGFQEKMAIFPYLLLANLAPHAQHIRELHIKSRYGGGRDDEAMIAAYEILLPFLEAFPDLTHLALTGVGFFFGCLYQDSNVDELQPHLHTFPSVTSLDLGPAYLTGMGVLQINILFPCLQTLCAITDIGSPSQPAPAGTVFAKLEHFSVAERSSTTVYYFLRLMPKLTSLKLQRLYFNQNPNSGENTHALIRSTFDAMTDNGVRLEHFALLNPVNDWARRAQDAPHVVQVQARFLQEILEKECFAELRSLELNIALDSFWPPEEGSDESTFTFGTIFSEPTLITKLQLGTPWKKQTVRPAMVSKLRQLVRILPCLEDLAIDEWLPDFSFFEGFGRCQWLC